jgi:hypothetical protein
VSLRFWLLAMDAIVKCGGFGSRPYLWTVRRAAATVPGGEVTCVGCGNGARELNEHWEAVTNADDEVSFLCPACIEEGER